MPGKAKPKANGTTGASGARKAAAKVKSPAKTKPAAAAESASRLIDERIRSLDDWRGETLGQVRRLIHEADPEVVEEVKWVKPTNPLGVPVWSHEGILCTGEVYKDAVKLTFAHGASLPDPHGLFNASLEGNMRRAIDVREGELPDAKAFKTLIQAAVALNLRRSASRTKASKAGTKTDAKGGTAPVLLSGGNPQIPKGEGDAPVQAYIAAMPGWKREVGQRLDALIVRTVPHVRKAVKWNSPFYGVEGQGWFLSFHVFTHYVKVTFFQGAALRPVPPGGTEKSKEARWIDVREGALDEAQMAAWVKQAAAMPGWIT